MDRPGAQLGSDFASVINLLPREGQGTLTVTAGAKAHNSLQTQ